MHFNSLLSILFAMTTRDVQPSSKPTKVVVIGAGFSGLSVAYHLLQARDFDVDVEILEARDRIGGRVWPFEMSRGGISPPVRVDLGGQWLHEASLKNPLRQLMKDLNLKFVPRKVVPHGAENDAIYNPDGSLISKATLKTAQRIFYKALNEFEVDDPDVTENTSFQDLLDKQLRLTKASDERMSCLDGDELQRSLNYMVHRTEGYEGGMLHELSAKLSELYENMGGPDEVPEGTYRTLLEAIKEHILKANCGECRIQMRLSTSVIKIQYNNAKDFVDGSNVAVTIQGNNDKTSTIECDFCVCTVPLGVLKQQSIMFDPPLPPPRIESFDKIGMGLLNKIVFCFDKCFWKGHGKRIGIAHDDIAQVKLFYDCTKDVMDKSDNGGILIQFLAGKAASRVDSVDSNGSPMQVLTDEEAIEESLEALRSVFGHDSVPDPISTKVTRWRQDPYAYGSYSFAKVGATGDMYDEIASPLGNLLFAGEHTSKHAHSTVHGAWSTGQREAKRIVDIVKN